MWAYPGNLLDFWAHQQTKTKKIFYFRKRIKISRENFSSWFGICPAPKTWVLLACLVKSASHSSGIRIIRVSGQRSRRASKTRTDRAQALPRAWGFSVKIASYA
jgi:hypothetical protein